MAGTAAGRMVMVDGEHAAMSRPVNGRNSRHDEAGGDLHVVAAMEPASEWPEQLTDLAALLRAHPAAMEPASEWPEQAPRPWNRGSRPPCRNEPASEWPEQLVRAHLGHRGHRAAMEPASEWPEQVLLPALMTGQSLQPQ